MNTCDIKKSAVPSGYLYLGIIANRLDIDDISKMLKLQPTSVRLNTKAGLDHWDCGFEEQELYHFDEMQRNIIDIFRGKEEILKVILRKYNAEITFNFVAYNVIDCVIGINFKREFIAFAHDISATIDIDSYFKIRDFGDIVTMSDEQDLILIKKM